MRLGRRITRNQSGAPEIIEQCIERDQRGTSKEIREAYRRQNGEKRKRKIRVRSTSAAALNNLIL